MIKSHTLHPTIITTGAVVGNTFFSRPERYDGLSSIGVMLIVFLADCCCCCCCCCSFAKNVHTPCGCWKSRVIVGSASGLDGGNVSRGGRFMGESHRLSANAPPDGCSVWTPCRPCEHRHTRIRVLFLFLILPSE